MKKLLVAAAIVGLVALIVGPVSAAGKGGGPVATIAFAGSADARLGAPERGDSVSFAVSPLRVKDRDLGHLWVTNICRVNGVPVIVQDRGVDYPSYREGIAGVFTLDGASWTDGAASCTAYVWMYPDAGSALRGASMSYTVGG